MNVWFIKVMKRLRVICQKSMGLFIFEEIVIWYEFYYSQVKKD